MATVQRAQSQRLQRLSIQATQAFVESGLHGIGAEVVLALDASAPMAPMYASGALQDVVTCLLALGMKFDDDGVIPSYAFSERVTSLGDLTRDELDGWISRVVVPVAVEMPAGCCYAPIIEAVGRRWFPREWAIPATEQQLGDKLKKTVRVYPSLIDPRPWPLFVLVVTAGDCVDPVDTARALRRASHLPIFWQFAAVTPPGQVAGFTFLDKLDKLERRHVDNCGVFQPGESLDPRTLFRGLLNEFPDYLELPAVSAMLIPPAEPAPAPPTELVVDSALLSLPEQEAARRERERQARQRRRAERGVGAEVPEEAMSLRETDVPQATGGETPGEMPRKRVLSETRPYVRGETRLPGLPDPPPQVATPRSAPIPRPRATSDAEQEPLATRQAARPGPAAPDVHDAAIRLARIRARRAARQVVASDDGDDGDPTVQ